MPRNSVCCISSTISLLGINLKNHNFLANMPNPNKLSLKRLQFVITVSRGYNSSRQLSHLILNFLKQVNE